MADHGTSLVSRVLPEAEWPRLAGLGACAVKPTEVVNGAVLVEECGDQIVGCAIVFQTPNKEAHLDGVWIHPAFRTGRVALRLWRSILKALEPFRVLRVSVYPTSPRLHAWASRMGGAHRRLRVKGLFTMEMAHGE